MNSICRDPRLSLESHQIFDAKQKIKLYMMRGSPELDDSESELSDDNDNDFINYQLEEDRAKKPEIVEKPVAEKAAQNKDILPNKVDRMLLPLFDLDAASPTLPTIPALPALPALVKGQKSKPIAKDDPYSKFGAITGWIFSA